MINVIGPFDVIKDEFQVGDESHGVVAVNSDGSFSVAWHEGTPIDVWWQRFDASGNLVGGSQEMVNQTTTNDQSNPGIATDGTNRRVIVWSHEASAGNWDVYGRIWNNGSWVTNEFQVNATTGAGDPEPHPAVCMYKGGTDQGYSVIVWCHRVDDLNEEIRISVYDTSGTEVVNEQLVASSTATGDLATHINGLTTTLRRQFGFVDIACQDNGEIVVVWEEFGSKLTIKARRFNPQDSPGSWPAAFTVSTPDASVLLQRRPKVSLNTDGEFVVTWMEAPTATPTDDFSVASQVRWFDALDAGSTVKTLGSGLGNVLPTVLILSDGQFIVSWTSLITAPQSGIALQLFSATSVPRTGPLLLGNYPGKLSPRTGLQGRTSLACRETSGEVDLVAIWESNHSGSTLSYGRILHLNELPSWSTFDGVVAASAEDWHWIQSSNTFSNSATTMRMGRDGTGVFRNIAFKISNVNVPQGARINGAYVSLYVDSATGVAQGILTAVDADNPSAPTTYTDAENAVETTAYVDWAMQGNNANRYEISADIGRLIQEIVARPGWVSGNSIIVQVQANEAASWVTGAGKEYRTYDNAPSVAPKLHIEYRSGGVGVADVQVSASINDGNRRNDNGAGLVTNASVRADAGTASNTRWGGGIRWPLAIPQGATILSAHLRGFVISTSNDDPLVAVHAEAVDNSADYSASPNPWSRSLTTASINIDQTSVDAGWYGGGLDISPLIQEVINRPGWSSGNYLSILILGASTATRSFQIRAYDGSTSQAAMLHVTYEVPTDQIVITNVGQLSIIGQQATVVADTTITAPTAGILNIAGLSTTINVPDVTVLTQTHYRWRNDDGDEANATWAQAEDIQSSVPSNQNIRLRVQVDADGDPNPAQFTLEYRVVGSNNPWVPVPLGPQGDAVLLEDGTYLLLEDGSYLLLE